MIHLQFNDQVDQQLLPGYMLEIFPFYITDYDGKIVYTNDKFADLTQYSKNELIGKAAASMQNHHLSKKLEDWELVDHVPLEKVEIEYITKKNGTFWGITTLLPIVDEMGEQSYTFAIISDVSQSNAKYYKNVHSLEYLKTLEMAINESNAIVVTDMDGKIIHVNKRYSELTQYKPEELIGQNPKIISSGVQSPAFYKDMWNTILSGNIWTGVLKNKAKDGSTFWVNSTIVPVKNSQGEPKKFISIQTEITARLELEKSLQQALKNDFENTVRNLHNIIFKYEKQDGEIVFTLVAGKMLDKLGLKPDELSMQFFQKLYDREKYQEIKKHFEKALSGEPTQFELSFEEYTLLVYLSPLYQKNEVMEVVGTVLDITNRKNAENLVRKMAYYDFMTNLPNRRYLQEHAESLLTKHLTENETCALVFIDIDRFKTINDSMGHTAGDELLVEFAKRLKTLVSEEDIVARLGGDEFIILLPHVTEDEARETVEYIAQHLRNPFQCRDMEIYVTPSIGISMFPRDGSDYDTLLGSADIAMYKNKRERNKNYQFFTKELKQNLLERTLLEMDLRQAIEKEQFHLVYQPIYKLNTKEIVGVEALIRWEHPVKGMISPGVFIPLAEETGMIVKLGNWVIKEACRQMKSWLDAGLPLVTMAVNISIAQFNHPLFVDFVKDALQESALDPQYLNIEVTESMMLDLEQSLKTFRQLEEIGTPISVDDFGTGYSSLSYLSNFPISHLKIDQSFIHQFTKTNKAIVKTIIHLAKSLNIEVIAEGVETVSQEAFLKQLDCDLVQGYLYAKPLSATEIEQKLSKQIYAL